MNVASAIFWTCASVLFYVYAGYPLLVWLLGVLFRREVARAPFRGRVSVLISVYNDAARLAPKLRGLLNVTGAEKISEVLVGSDGSTDDIGAVFAGIGDPRVHLTSFPQRRGKASVLNDLMGRATGDVVVLTDARQMLQQDALEQILAPFADENVGVVSGHLVFRRADGESAGTQGVGAYWSYEKTIRRFESRFSSVPGATGALYAVRRSLLRPIPEETILDDVAIPMLAVEQGSRCILADEAVCLDDPSASVGQEQIRKRRTLAGNLQLVALFPRWIVPWRNPVWIQFISHKLLRLLSPFLLAGMLVTSAMLCDRTFFAAILALQLLAYGLAFAGWAGGRHRVRSSVLSVPMVFVALNVTIVQAWADALRGRFSAAWKKSGGD